MLSILAILGCTPPIATPPPATPTPSTPTADTGPSTPPPTPPTPPISAAPHELTADAADYSGSHHGPSHLDRMLDGRILRGYSRNWNNEFCIGQGAFLAQTVTHTNAVEIAATSYDDTPIYGCSQVGARSFAIGDATGDGIEEIALTSPTFPRTVVYDGTSLVGDFVGGPSESGALEYEGVGNWLTRCDLDDDGIADLCSTHGFALGPLPFQPVLLVQSSPEDRIVTAIRQGTSGVVISRGATLSFVPGSALPTSQQLPSVRTASTQLQGPVRAMLETHGHLLVLVETPTNVLLVELDIDDFALVDSFEVGMLADGPYALEVGDYDGDGDGDRDIALASGLRVGILDQVTPDAQPTWYVSPTFSESAFGQALLTEPTAGGDALWIADPHQPGPNVGSPRAGIAFRVPTPLLP